jgi:hypothetical protein
MRQQIPVSGAPPRKAQRLFLPSMADASGLPRCRLDSRNRTRLTPLAQPQKSKGALGGQEGINTTILSIRGINR